MTIRTILFFFLIINLFNCEEVTSQKETVKIDTIQKVDSTFLFNPENHYNNYKNLKHRVKKLKTKVNQKQNSAEKLSHGKELFTNLLVDSIFSYWYGTTWDFNGHTKTPRNGDIACGYFVSTTIKDMGVQLNRYKLAQKAAADIVKQLCKAPTIKIYDDLEKLKSYLSDLQNNEVLILGLDYHVGFVVRRDGKNYFIHSNYISREGVIKEELETSVAIRSSNIYMIGNVTRNDQLILDWLN
ncbi:MAG: hypothetical protein AB8H03_18525 [Saprospiraceae bacterium]